MSESDKMEEFEQLLNVYVQSLFVSDGIKIRKGLLEWARVELGERDAVLLLERMVKAYSPAMGRDGVALEIERAETLNAARAYLALRKEPK